MLAIARHLSRMRLTQMITFSIQSGSNGNCIYVEAGDTRLEQESDRLFEVARKKPKEVSKPRRGRDGQKA